MQNPIVRVHQGKLRGHINKNVNGKYFVAFRGVPYAKPPIGDLRFKDSEPLEPWTGVRNATAFGERCAQQDWFTRGYLGSDDCLNLNIYTTNVSPPKKKAVMVWIPGGSFIYGSNRDDIYGPDFLIEKDIVLVVLNYRLGILGFLNIGDEEAPGNQGLKDQVQALRWVQQNIAQFGGDPNNVTICGDSAGGVSVHYLTISPLAHGLFHKAIIQSGSIASPWASTFREPMESVKKLAAVLEKDCSDVKEFVNFLRTLPTDRLVEASVNIETQEDKILLIHPFVPSVDSKAKNPFLTVPWNEAIKAGIKVPLICGYVSHEGIIAVGGMTKDMLDDIGKDVDNLLVHPRVLRFLETNNISHADVKQYYFDNKPISSVDAEKLAELLSDTYFVLGLHQTIEIQTKVPDVPMYLYKFEYDPEVSMIKKCMGVNLKGACHGEELTFLFYQKLAILVGRKPPLPGSFEHNLTQRFIELWTNFAKTGNPTPHRTAQMPFEWEPVDKSGQYKCLHVTNKLAMGTITNLLQQYHECKKISTEEIKNHI